MTTTNRPNILLLMTDQQRGDCLGIENHPVLQTPYLDALGTSGFHFRRAYSACPVCIPARRTLMTGRKPVSHVPFLIKLPGSMKIPQGRKVDAVVELMDIMPTLLEAAGVPIPESVDGKSVLPLLRGETSAIREYLHGECSEIPSLNSGMQYLTDGHKKYIYYPGDGHEHYFDLDNDPHEMNNLADNPACANELKEWRQLLVQELQNRPEKFTENGRLRPVNGPTSPALPEYMHKAQ